MGEWKRQWWWRWWPETLRPGAKDLRGYSLGKLNVLYPPLLKPRLRWPTGCPLPAPPLGLEPRPLSAEPRPAPASKLGFGLRPALSTRTRPCRPAPLARAPPPQHQPRPLIPSPAPRWPTPSSSAFPGARPRPLASEPRPLRL